MGLSSMTGTSRRSASGKRVTSASYSRIIAWISSASDRSIVEASISRIVLRARSTRSLRVWTFIPAPAWTMQAGWSRRIPSTSTTQMRHKAFAVVASWKQMVGISMPFRRAASRRVMPSSIVISLPSMSRVTDIISPYLLKVEGLKWKVTSFRPATFDLQQTTQATT